MPPSFPCTGTPASLTARVSWGGGGGGGTSCHLPMSTCKQCTLPDSRKCFHTDVCVEIQGALLGVHTKFSITTPLLVFNLTKRGRGESTPFKPTTRRGINVDPNQPFSLHCSQSSLKLTNLPLRRPFIHRSDVKGARTGLR